ncbi:MAG TPA: hypothetical protein VKH45_07065 [Candidatus Acidoferrum sp.]|nr:hypothetical protein [Candidatus Acidoferrum sp.]
MRKSYGSAARKLLGVMTFVFLAVSAAPVSAQIAPNGRWEFAVTSGDTQYELDLTGQTTFSTYLNLTGTTLTGDSQQTTNTTSAEIFCCNDSVTGTFRTHNRAKTAVVEFAVPANSVTGQEAFNYTFTGTFNANPSDSGGPTITGTYTTNASSTVSNGAGTFVATWFPDFPATPQMYVGGLASPDIGSGPSDVPTILTIGTNSITHDLIGTVSVPGLTSNGAACFVGTLTIQSVDNSSLMGVGGAPNGVGVPYASGVGLYIFAQDSAGTQLWLNGYSAKPDGNSAAVDESFLDNTDCDGDKTTTNNGTNNELILYYGVTGGPCDGLGGGDAPFHPVKKLEHSKSHRHDKRFADSTSSSGSSSPQTW